MVSVGRRGAERFAMKSIGLMLACVACSACSSICAQDAQKDIAAEKKEMKEYIIARAAEAVDVAKGPQADVWKKARVARIDEFPWYKEGKKQGIQVGQKVWQRLQP